MGIISLMASNPLIMSTLAGEVALGTLAGSTAVFLHDGADTEMKAPFLIKQVQMHAGVHNLNETDGIIIGLCQGNAVIAEIASMMLQLALSPFDVDERFLLQKKQLIFWETLTYVSLGENTVNERFKIGGGKGIPIGEDNGINVFAFNPSATALTTGARLTVSATLKGVWLGD